MVESANSHTCKPDNIEVSRTGRKLETHGIGNEPQNYVGGSIAVGLRFINRHAALFRGIGRAMTGKVMCQKAHQIFMQRPGFIDPDSGQTPLQSSSVGSCNQCYTYIPGYRHCKPESTRLACSPCFTTLRSLTLRAFNTKYWNIFNFIIFCVRVKKINKFKG